MEAEHSPALRHLIWNLKKDYSHQRGTLCCFFYLTFDPQIALLMNAAGNGHLLSRVLYPDTGHLIEPPYSPHFRASNFKAAGVATKTGESSWYRVTQALCFVFFSTPPNREPSLPFYGLFYLLCPLGGVERHLLYKLFDYYFCASVMLLWGGQTKAHSDAQEDAWKKILSFLQHNLYSSTSLRAKLWTVTYEHITAGGQWSSVWHHVYYLKTTIMCLAVLTRSEDWSWYHSITLLL